MKVLAATVACISLFASSLSYAESVKSVSLSDIRAVSPALEKYAQSTVASDLWKRPGLSPRDRSIVTVAVMVSRNQAADLASQLNLALDNGVKPAEISEVITHLAFYSGWANAMSAVAITKDVFKQRKIAASQLPAASPQLLPIDQAAEERRENGVQQTVSPISPGLVEFTRELLFKDLWLRPDLAPRDRSLVTVSSLIASGQSAQVTFHLNRAMDNGLTKPQAQELLTHLAFYAGWPNVFSAVPVVKGVFDSRSDAK